MFDLLPFGLAQWLLWSLDYAQSFSQRQLLDVLQTLLLYVVVGALFALLACGEDLLHIFLRLWLLLVLLLTNSRANSCVNPRAISHHSETSLGKATR